MDIAVTGAKEALLDLISKMNWVNGEALIYELFLLLKTFAEVNKRWYNQYNRIKP